VHKADIEYVDYINGDKKAVETFYFNITVFELVELMADFPGDLSDVMRRAFSDPSNYKDGFRVLRALAVKGYGRRKPAEDGTDRMRFIKKPEWIQELLPSPEFEALYLKLEDDTEFATKFWNGLVSKELMDRANKIREAEDGQPAATPAISDKPKKFRDMTAEEKLAALQAKVSAKGIKLDEE
jgi:hypothetical protein